MTKPKPISVPDLPGFETTIEPIPERIDPLEYLRQQMDDCPDCREARARGEVPVSHTGEELKAMLRPRPSIFTRRPRWRTMKKAR